MASLARRSAAFVAVASLAIAPQVASAKHGRKAFFKVNHRRICVGPACVPPPPVPPALKPLLEPIETNTVLQDEAGKAVAKISGNVYREAGIGIGNVDRESKRGLGQVERNLRKSGNDFGMQLKRSQKDVGDLGTAVYRYVLHESDADRQLANSFERRFREGKIIDALWSLGTERAQTTDKNAAEAALSSSVLSTVGSVAASVYGGPEGAAAYAAWLAYHKTCEAGKCDANLAVKVGMIAAATTYANGQANAISNVGERAAVMGAIAGAAVAASGGKPQDINDAVFRAGASVLVQEGYREYVGRDALEESKPAFGPAMCMSVSPTAVGPQNCAQATQFMKDKDGNFLLLDKDGNYQNVPESGLSSVPTDWKLIGDASSTPPGTPVVGIQTDHLPPDSWKNEGSTFMTTVAKVPGMNEMALFHDRWTVNWVMSSNTAVMGSIPVAMVLTYTGDTLVYDAKSSRAIIDAAIKNGKLTEAEVSRVRAGGELTVSVPQSIACNKGQQFQAMDVAWGTEEEDLKCAVVVTTNGAAVPDATWYAHVQADYCSQKIQDMAVPLLKAGWRCKAR